MTRWEYTNVRIPNTPAVLTMEMDEFGRIGWELVCLSEPVCWKNTSEYERLATFKRPLPPKKGKKGHE